VREGGGGSDWRGGVLWTAQTVKLSLGCPVPADLLALATVTRHSSDCSKRETWSFRCFAPGLAVAFIPRLALRPGLRCRDVCISSPLYAGSLLGSGLVGKRHTDARLTARV
jgi:hypothetical protein